MTPKETIHLYLIRHAEAAKSWHEDPDPGLSPLGQSQTSSLAEQLIPSIYSKSFQVITSPLLRAKQTAQLFLEQLDINLITDSSFSEIPSPGISLAQRQEWLNEIYKIKITELDPFLMMWRNNIIQSIENLEQNTLIFSHFMVINCIIGWIQNAEQLESFSPDYCSMTKIEKTGGNFRLIDLGHDLRTTIN